MAGKISETPVLIVGGGPVGLALANELGWRGIDCVLVERRDGVVRHPKMNQVSMRTMEFCRRWGFAPKVPAAGIPLDFPRNYLFVTSVNGYELARFEYPPSGDLTSEHSPETVQRCSQLWFDPLLRDNAAAMKSVSLRFNTELRSFEQDAGGVTAELVDLESGAVERIHARYVAACDGAESILREAVGIALDGDDALSHDINVLFRSTDLDALLPKGPAVMQWVFGDNGLWSDVVAIDGREHWRLGLTRFPPGSTVDKDEAAVLVRKAVGRDFDFEVVSVLPWTRRPALAQRYRSGNLFLVGDSAHQMSPTGGFGMNTGIAEAVDLGWKLAAVIDGWGGAGLLDSYDSERRPVAARVIAEGTHNFSVLVDLPHGPEIADDTPEGRGLRDRIADIILNQGFDREYDTDGVILGYRYENSPVMCPDGTPPPPDDPMEYVPTARPGHRAPHAWLADGRSTLDLFGRGFTLLRLDGTADPAPLVDAARARGVPVETVDIDDDAIRRLYRTSLVLVRPDGQVSWRGDAAPPDPAVAIDRVRGA